MKLQLNENELNAYINEAIKQELINETCYRVNFETLGKPANAQTRPMRAKVINALKSGEYGKNNPGKLIKKLKEVGYSDEQIQAGIRNGAVQVAQSFDPATGQAVLYDVKTQNKKLQKLLNAANAYMYDYNQKPEPEEPETPSPDTTPGETTPAPTPETTPAPTPETTPTNPSQATGFPWDGIVPQWSPRPARPKRTAPARTTPEPARTAPEETPATPEPVQTREPIQAVSAQPSKPIQLGQVQGPNTLIRRPEQPSIAKATGAEMAQNQLAGNGNLNGRAQRYANGKIDQAVKHGDMTKSQGRDAKDQIRQFRRNINNAGNAGQ